MTLLERSQCLELAQAHALSQLVEVDACSGVGFEAAAKPLGLARFRACNVDLALDVVHFAHDRAHEIFECKLEVCVRDIGL
jgi:hypothetical protein